MIFGEKFYPKLRKMSPWRQSLFALVLANRQLANFALYAEQGEKSGLNEFIFCLKTLWHFHQEKFNHIDLEKTLDVFTPFVPVIDDDNYNLGDMYALDSALSLTAAFDAIIMHEGNEAEIASRTSLSGVLRLVQMDFDEDVDDDVLREDERVDNEVNFQVSIFELLATAKRDIDLVHNLIIMAQNGNISNIGIELPESLLNVSKDFSVSMKKKDKAYKEKPYKKTTDNKVK